MTNIGELVPREITEEVDRFLNDASLRKGIDEHTACVLARHFVEWGKTHYHEPNEELDNEIERYIQEDNHYYTTIQDTARFFAEWQRKQMLNQSIDAVYKGKGLSRWIELEEEPKDLSLWDKCQVIIIKDK